jgi:hypothetical protein
MQADIRGEYEDGGEMSNDENSAASHCDLGATIMWFGKHQGARLDKLDECYRRILVHLSYENPSPNVSRKT